MFSPPGFVGGPFGFWLWLYVLLGLVLVVGLEVAAASGDLGY